MTFLRKKINWDIMFNNNIELFNNHFGPPSTRYFRFLFFFRNLVKVNKDNYEEMIWNHFNSNSGYYFYVTYHKIIDPVKFRNDLILFLFLFFYFQFVFPFAIGSLFLMCFYFILFRELGSLLWWHVNCNWQKHNIRTQSVGRP